MALNYEITKTKIGFGKDKTDAYVGRIQLGNTISTEKLEEQVAIRTLLPQSVIHTVFSNIVASVVHFTEEGAGVRLGELGIIRPSISTKSAAESDEVEVQKVRLRYLPSVKMREAVAKFTVKKVGEDDADTSVDDEEDTTTDTGGDTGDGGETFT